MIISRMICVQRHKLATFDPNDCISTKIMEESQYKECDNICLPIIMQSFARLGNSNNSWPICEKAEENACMIKPMFNKMLSSSKA